MYNAANRKDIRRAEKSAALVEARRKHVISSLMQHIDGRAYVHERLAAAHVFSSSFTGDALTSAFAEGERNQGLQLLNDVISSCPDLYVLMMKEANERTLADTARAERDRDTGGSESEADRDEAEWVRDIRAAEG